MSQQLLQEISAGHGLSLTQLARRLPSSRRGRPVSLSCVLRWILDGARDNSGQRIRLEAARLAGKWISTPQALARFMAAQTPAPISMPGQIGQSPDGRSHDRTEQDLDRIGI